MRGHEDGSVAIRVVIEERVVELLPVKKVKAERGLVQHEQAGIDGHPEREVKLCLAETCRMVFFSPVKSTRSTQWT